MSPRGPGVASQQLCCDSGPLVGCSAISLEGSEGPCALDFERRLHGMGAGKDSGNRRLDLELHRGVADGHSGARACGRPRVCAGIRPQLRASGIQVQRMLVSIIIRTLDEERHLQALLEGIESQEIPGVEVETVVVDSGSADRTLEIAEEYGCQIEHIAREAFSFGSSLNQGCARSRGEVLVFVSGHCVPCDPHWLAQLVQPICESRAQYVYGRQLPGPATRFSEAQLFARQYPETSEIPQRGIFCNNANAALRRDVWEKFEFSTDCLGLEDMELAKRIVAAGHAIGYQASARVFHHHDERWNEVRWRFEREAVALQDIMPDVHIGPLDFARYFVSAVLHDLGRARAQGRALRSLCEIVCFRWQQYLGSYRGNHKLRVLSRRNMDHYFYPKRLEVDDSSGGDSNA